MSMTENLQSRANALRLYGLLAHWPELTNAGWVEPLVQWEEDERPAVRLNDAFVTPIWVTSNRCATSTGRGPRAATGSRSKS